MCMKKIVKIQIGSQQNKMIIQTKKVWIQVIIQIIVLIQITRSLNKNKWFQNSNSWISG